MPFWTWRPISPRACWSIEFISPEDSMFRRLVRGREDLFRGLDAARFEEACRRRFDILEMQHAGRRHPMALRAAPQSIVSHPKPLHEQAAADAALPKSVSRRMAPRRRDLACRSRTCCFIRVWGRVLYRRTGGSRTHEKDDPLAGGRRRGDDGGAAAGRAGVRSRPAGETAPGRSRIRWRFTLAALRWRRFRSAASAGM